MPDAAVTASATQVLGALMLGGLMGLLGQGARTIVGMKSMVDEANAKGVSQDDLFRTARLLFSLLVGFLVGVAAAMMLGLDKLLSFPLDNLRHPESLSTLLGIAAAGYAGTDFIEGFISRYLPGSAQPQQTTQSQILWSKNMAGLTDEQALAIISRVIRKNHPDAKVTKESKLKQWKYDEPTDAVTLADGVYEDCGRYIKSGDILTCTTVADVIVFLKKT